LSGDTGIIEGGPALQSAAGLRLVAGGGVCVEDIDARCVRRAGLKYRKMLVPLDSSRFAECVLDHVKEIATTRAIPEVVLYSVVEPLPEATAAYMGDDRVQESEKRARAAMLEYLGNVKKQLNLSGSTVTTLVETGKPADRILDFIEHKDVDIVVMAKSSREDAARLFVGSVTDKVLRGSTSPVFLVPSPACGG